MKGKILIVDTIHPSIFPELEALGFASDYLPDISRGEVLKIISGYRGIIVRSKLTIDADLLKRASQLEFIARAGAGVDLIDVTEVNNRGIKIFNAGEGNRNAVAEHAIGMLLCLLNKIHTSDREVRNFQWRREENRGYELGKLTVGIVGYGNTGRAFAKRLSGFGCKILAYDKYHKLTGDELVKEAGMEEIYSNVDILSLHIPLNIETKGMINKDFLDRFKKKIWLVNTSRGEIVKLKDLNEALDNRTVSGAALDVLENENLHNLNIDQKLNLENLVKRDNVVFTPHVAGWTFESLIKINQTLVGKIRDHYGS
ncbi:MAG: NAD(P)-dependent oxidoreductase [Cytophagaceae bacterium]